MSRSINPGAFNRGAVDRWAAERGLKHSIVANGCNVPIGSASVTGTQYSSSVRLYCPDGIRALELFFAGIRVSTNAETNLTGASAMNISVAITPPPWLPGKAYSVGDLATWNPTQASGYAGNPIYKAVAANVNSLPGPGNPDWVAGEGPLYHRATVGGQPACGSKTVTLPDGSVVTEGFWKTDPIDIPGGDGECFIDVRCWVKDGGGIAFSSGSSYPSGSYFESGASITDRTSGGYPSGPSHLGATAALRPALARGVPARASARKSVVIITDSIGAGTCCGQSGNSLGSIALGGTGFTSADIGKLLMIDNSGGQAEACSIPAIVCITNVAGGAVTGARLWHGGSYANTGLPSGARGTLPLSADVAAALGVPIMAVAGTGFSISVNFTGGGFDFDPATYANGFLQRGINLAQRRWTAFASPGDTLQGWASRSYTRFALLAQGNVDAAIVELGINDITAGRTLAQLKADAILMYQRLRGLGVRQIVQTTILPFPTSTDGGATLGNQTVNSAQDAIRQQFNTWVRAGADGLLDGYIDAAAAIEVGGASAPTGKHIVNGAPGYVFIDGKHPTPRIIPTLAAVVRDYVEAHF